MSTESLRAALKAAPETHRTLAEKAFDLLHEAIVTGVLEPGERLPIEDLARSLDMSPMPIREALRRLDSVGLVENVPHRGARVTSLSSGDLVDVYAARLALETLAIRDAAENFTAEDERRARDVLEAHREAVEGGMVRQIWLTHTEFHFVLYRASRSKWLPRLIRPLWESSERYRFASPPIQRSIADRMAEHDLILDACAAHNPGDAARELHDHLARTANAVAESMGGSPPFELMPDTSRSGSR